MIKNDVGPILSNNKPDRNVTYPKALGWQQYF